VLANPASFCLPSRRCFSLTYLPPLAAVAHVSHFLQYTLPTFVHDSALLKGTHFSLCRQIAGAAADPTPHNRVQAFDNIYLVEITQSRSIHLSTHVTVTFPASPVHSRTTPDCPSTPSYPSPTTHLTNNMPCYLPILRSQPAFYVKIPRTALFLRAPTHIRRWPGCQPQEVVVARSLAPRLPRNTNPRTTTVCTEQPKAPNLLVQALDESPSQRRLGLESSPSRPSWSRRQDWREEQGRAVKAREEAEQARRTRQEEREDKAEDRKDGRIFAVNTMITFSVAGVVSCFNRVSCRKWPYGYWESEGRRGEGVGGLRMDC
jgi:hypothetical protein